MNAIIWVRQGKLQLALANISGAMMIQATVPSASGCSSPRGCSTPRWCSPRWHDGGLGYLLTMLRRGRLTPGRLAAAALFYVGFAVALVTYLT